MCLTGPLYGRPNGSGPVCAPDSGQTRGLRVAPLGRNSVWGPSEPSRAPARQRNCSCSCSKPLVVRREPRIDPAPTIRSRGRRELLEQNVDADGEGQLLLLKHQLSFLALQSRSSSPNGDLRRPRRWGIVVLFPSGGGALGTVARLALKQIRALDPAASAASELTRRSCLRPPICGLDRLRLVKVSRRFEHRLLAPPDTFE